MNGGYEREQPPAPEVTLRDQILEDTILFADESIDRTFIEAYEGKYYDSKPFPPMHGNHAVYFHIGQSPARDSLPIVNILFRPSDAISYLSIPFVISDASTLLIGPHKIFPQALDTIKDVAKKRSYTQSYKLERAVNTLVGEALR